MNFNEFQKTRTKVADLRDIKSLWIEYDEVVPGYTYCDGSFYIEVIDRPVDDDRPTFNVVLGSGEYLFESLPEAEKWFWDNFVKDEMAQDPSIGEYLQSLADAAKPINEDDWGSERQVKAQNLFFVELEKELSTEDFEAVEEYAMKATAEEMIDYGMARFENPKFAE